MSSEETPIPQWWVISDKSFKDALERVKKGEEPDLVYAEYFVNSTFRTFDRKPFKEQSE